MINNIRMHPAQLSQMQNSNQITNRSTLFDLPSPTARINQIYERSQHDNNLDASAQFQHHLGTNSHFQESVATITVFSETLDHPNDRINEQINRRTHVILGHCSSNSNKSRIKRQNNQIKNQFNFNSEKTQKVLEDSANDQDWSSRMGVAKTKKEKVKGIVKLTTDQLDRPLISDRKSSENSLEIGQSILKKMQEEEHTKTLQKIKDLEEQALYYFDKHMTLFCMLRDDRSMCVNTTSMFDFSDKEQKCRKQIDLLKESLKSTSSDMTSIEKQIKLVSKI